MPLPPSTVKTVALIDTGTKKTCLATKLIQKLGLPRSQSSIDFQSAMYHGPAQVHFIDFILPFNGTSHIFPHLEVLEISFDAGDIEVLLGLDILCQGIFIINADKSFSFAL